MLELENGEFVRASQIEDAAMANSALAVVRMQLKDALFGLSPLFTKQVLLSVCNAVIDEDSNPSGHQTERYSDRE